MGLLDRLFGQKKKTPTSSSGISGADAEHVIQAFGNHLASSAPVPGCVADTAELPFPKERIKAALVFALKVTEDLKMREHFVAAYTSLADWQDGVGPTHVGLDLSQIDADADPLRAAKQIAEQGPPMGKWAAAVKAEEAALWAELKSQGLI